ncbi:MAG: citrate transporter [Ignavibacteria bacterium CG2_30_36_16]|nr:MAG: citrate transporter [Ignavibacteria bacterium CG2_30_36_16]
METVQIILLILVFVLLAALMFFRKIPALLALPIMAFSIPIVAGVSVNNTVQLVLGMGSTRLFEAYTIAIFGSMLSILLQKTGVAESFIKIGAELSGDKPWIIAFIMLVLISLLFTTLGGLGAIIMVATVVLPIMASVGVGPLTTVGVFLFGLSMGGILNVGNWAVYITVLNLNVDEVRSFALVMFGITFVVSLIYLTIQLYRDGHDINIKRILIKSIIFVIVITAASFGYSSLNISIKNYIGTALNFMGTVFQWFAGMLIGLLFLAAIIRMITNKNYGTPLWISYFTPIIPLFLILIFNINFIAAFIVGLLYGFISTYKKNSLNTLVRSILEGGAVVMPAVALMLGIGMLLNAVMGPGGDIISAIYPEGWPVLNLLQPLMRKIVPQNAFVYVLLFTAAAPLALYRGPLNVWGMGFGLAAIFLTSGMNPGAIMGLLLSVGQIQGISDPTNTQNVWLANEMRVDVQKILWNTIPYTWIIALIGLIVSALMFY